MVELGAGRASGGERCGGEREVDGSGRRRDEPDHGDSVGARDEVVAAVATLTPEEREVISLRFGADLTAPQIAKVLDVPLTTVEGRLYRALRRLRERLDAPSPQT